MTAKKVGHMGHIGHMGRSPMGQRDHSGYATVKSFARDARYSSEFASLAVEG